MPTARPNTSRGHTRLVLFAKAVLVCAPVLASAGCGDGGVTNRPVAVPNPDYVAPTESVIGGIRHIYHVTAREQLIVDTLRPKGDATLLWFQGLPVSRDIAGRGVVLDGAGGVVAFDSKLKPHRVRLAVRGRDPMSVAADRDGGLWVVTVGGEVYRISDRGEITSSVPAVFDRSSAFPDPHGGVWLTRSTRLFSFRLATDHDPLMVHVGDGSGTRSLGSIVLPEHVLLAEIANAGHVAATADAIFFAPFIRDEVVAFSRLGDTLWVAHRGLPQSTSDPRFEIGSDGPTIDYAPVNLGLSIGPDGTVFVLSVPGFSTTKSRLDILDPLTGSLIRTATLSDPLPTIAARPDGRVIQLDPFALLTGVAPAEREAAPAFDLDLLGGGTMSLVELEGKVVLANFWASWCAPCKKEMPALDSLRRSITDQDFTFITLNEDVDIDGAAGFIREFGFAFPVLLGRGRLRSAFHYYGLPFTILIDRRGRVVQRWIGFAGEQQIAGIRAVVQAELLRGRDGSGVDRDALHEGLHHQR